MVEEKFYGVESPAVHVHLGITQSVIQRMSSNSSLCKAWCITLVVAILVIVADKGNPSYVLIAGIPTVLFLVLDAYYLALEECFRNSYNSFIEKVHAGCVVTADLYVITPKRLIPKAFKQSLCSFSIWPFYGALGVIILLSMWIVIS